MTPGSPSRLAVIDAARGFAEFWVLAFHALMYTFLSVNAGVIGGCPTLPTDSSIPPLADPYQENWLITLTGPLRLGQMGVPIFFVISGFCIHWPAARAGSAFRFKLGYYCKRRFWRLYPTHFVAVVGSMLLAAGLWQWITSNGLGDCVRVPWSAWWAHFFMLQAQLPATFQYQYAYNPNLWSLETEFQLYAAYILIRPMANRLGWSKLLLFILLPVSIAWAAGAESYWGLGFEIPIKTCCLGHLFTWTLGAYVAECLCRRADPRPLIGWGALALFAYVTMIGSFSTAGFMAVGIATAWVLYHLLTREIRTGKTFPGCAWMEWWGVRSYSLYLWHAPVLRVFIVLAAVQAPWIRDSYYYAFGLSVVGAVASLYVARLAYWLVERHFSNIKATPSVRLRPTSDEPSQPSAELAIGDPINQV